MVLTGAEGLVVSKRRGAKRRMGTEELFNDFQEHVDVEGGRMNVSCLVMRHRHCQKQREKDFTARRHMHAQIQPELTYFHGHF